MIAILICWTLAAVITANDIILPSPLAVGERIVQLLITEDTYSAIGATLLRVMKGFLISLFTALILVIVSYIRSSIRLLFEPLYIILKTVPNATYIILALIWLGSEGAVSLVSCMILFPIFFNGFWNRLILTDCSVKDAELLYRETLLYRIRRYFLPQLLPEIFRTGKTAFSMGFKVGVMAEILGQVRVGIGRQIQLARLNLDTTSLFAWTVMIILLTAVSHYLFNLFIKSRSMEGHLWKD